MHACTSFSINCILDYTVDYSNKAAVYCFLSPKKATPSQSLSMGEAGCSPVVSHAVGYNVYCSPVYESVVNGV